MSWMQYYLSVWNGKLLVIVRCDSCLIDNEARYFGFILFVKVNGIWRLCNRSVFLCFAGYRLRPVWFLTLKLDWDINIQRTKWSSTPNSRYALHYTQIYFTGTAGSPFVGEVGWVLLKSVVFDFIVLRRELFSFWLPFRSTGSCERVMWENIRSPEMQELNFGSHWLNRNGILGLLYCISRWPA